MGNTQTVTIDKILGSTLSADRETASIKLMGGSGEYQLSLSRDQLTILALTALKASTELEARAAKLKQPDKTHTLPCDKWDIRKLANGEFLLFSFRHISGAWIRLQVSHKIATPMRETLEIVEGRTYPEPPSGARN